MSNICAGIGRGQMEVLDIHIAHHRHVQQLYREMLGGIKGITLHDNPSPFSTPTSALRRHARRRDAHRRRKRRIQNCNASTAVSAHTDSKPDAAVEALRIALDSANIEARPLGSPCIFSPCSPLPRLRQRSERKPFPPGDMPSRFYPWVSDEDVERIVATIASSIRI